MNAKSIKLTSKNQPILPKTLNRKMEDHLNLKLYLFGCLLVVSLVTLPAAWAQQAGQTEREAMYYRYQNLRSLVKGGSVEPHWMADGSSFWYQDDSGDESIIYKIGPIANTKEPLFDAGRLRRALAPLLGREPSGQGLPFRTFKFVDEDKAVKFSVDNKDFILQLDSYQISLAPATPTRTDEKKQVPRVIGRSPFGNFAKELSSPDGRWFATLKDHNVWLRSATDDTMVQLTTDGVEDYEYAPLVVDSGFPWWSSDNSFSPDSSKLAVKKTDWRKTPRLPLVHWLSPSRHVEFTRHVTADGPMPQSELFIVDVASRRNIRIDTGKEPDQRIIMRPGWRPNGSEFVFFKTNRSLEKIDLMAANPDSGSSRVILTTTGKEVLQFQGLSSLTILSDGERFMMLSERDGWNHLYLYDLEGNLIRQLTKGDFPILRIITIDEKAGWVYFTAHTDRQRPYDTHLCRVNLEGQGFKCLTEATGVHDVKFSPSKRFFLDAHSTIARPPVVELRSADGKLLCTLSKADIEALTELNWTPPEQFVVKAADGKTDLYGVLWKPYDFDPKKTYPVIEGIYGLIRTNVPHDFGGDRRGSHSKQALAQLGFIVFVVDARGTGGRGRAFGEANLRGLQLIPDHVAALQQLGAERPYMDLSRVGIYGGSFGGYSTIRALLTAPDVYHVGVAYSPLVDGEDSEGFSRHIGLFHENKGAFEDASNSRLAGNLKGKLLLAHGTSDFKTPFWGVMRLVDALARAGKPHDLIVEPEAGHGLVSPYAVEARRWYFQEHLKPVPTVEITRPAEGSYDIGEPVPLKAKATASADARVLRVEFLIDGVSIGVAPEPPYEFKWREAKKGRHLLSAKVYDSTGRTNESFPVTIFVGMRVVQRFVTLSVDDAEEFGDGQMYLDSSDLELIHDGRRGDQVVGIRFADIQVPKGTQIKKAYLQFTSAEVATEQTGLTIHAELADNVMAFTDTRHNISSRKRTSAAVKWSAEPWEVRHERSKKQRTPDLSSLIQEVVAQSDWQEGNALVFIITGSGERDAVSYDGDQQNAPVLYIEY